MATLISLGLILSSACALEIHQFYDSIILPLNSYYEINNINEVVGYEEGNLIWQNLTVQVSQYDANELFDVFIFEDEQSDDFQCYIQAIQKQLYNYNCPFLTQGG